MFSEYTPAVARALQSARQWAARCGADAVQPRHLLLGLVDEEEGRAATLLARAGLDAADIRQTAAAADAAPLATQPAPLRAGSEAVLDYAREIVGSFAVEGALTSEQVLL